MNMKTDKLNITLIGMAGAGKSTIGQLLAKELIYTFVDTDEIMAKREGLEIHTIIKNIGEKRFTNLEEKYILDLGDIKNSVISPGGSVIYSDKSMNFLKQNSVIVFLDAPYPKIKKRLEKRKNLSIIGLRQKGLKRLFFERFEKYNNYADITIQVGDRTAEEIVKEVLGLIKH